MTENWHRTKKIVFGLLGVLSLSGCVSSTQQPLVYPVIVPVYSSSGGYAQGGQQPYGMPQGAISPIQGYPNSGTSSDYGAYTGISAAASAQATQQKTAAPVSMPLQPISQMALKGMMAGHPSLTPEQRFQMADALFQYSAGAVDPVAKELAEVMQPMLEASACGIAWVPDMAARSYESAQSRAVSPFESTPGHDPSRCLDVHQIDNWRVSPPTRVAFRALFISPQTNERASRRFELMRGKEGWRYLIMNEPF